MSQVFGLSMRYSPYMSLDKDIFRRDIYGQDIRRQRHPSFAMNAYTGSLNFFPFMTLV